MVSHDAPADAGTLSDATELDAVADVQARYVARPRSTAEVADVLRMASRERLTVVMRGTGTKLDWGRAPERTDILLDTGRLVGVVDHAAGDLVLRVRAGTTMSSIATALIPKRQRLALTTRLPAQSGPLAGTVGGTIAANPGGPLRYAYGTVRDILIGVEIVRADGTIAHAGGAVVKNVAGYDLGKLLVGSLGTLGVITEAVFRLHPAPEAVTLVTRVVPNWATAASTATELRKSQLVPTAVEVDGPVDGPLTLAVLVEGVAEGVPARAARMAELLGPKSVVSPVASPARMPEWWFVPPADAAGTSLRVAVAPGGVGAMFESLRDSALDRGLAVRCRGSLGSGVVHAGLPGETDPVAVAALVEDLRIVAARYDGTVVAEYAPRAVHAELEARGTDVFGPVRGHALMRQVKHEFDPGRVLAPGRFVGGI